MSGRPKAPAGLGAAGRDLWRSVLDEVPAGLLLDSHEAELLEHAARTADHVAALEKAIRKDGVTVQAPDGRLIVSPALVEARQQRLLLQRLLGGIAVAVDEEAQPETPAQQQGRKAAQARWARRDVRELRAAQRRGSREA
jgi:hypothetical protein